MRRKKATRAEVQLQLWPEIAEDCSQLRRLDAEQTQHSVGEVEQHCRNSSDAEIAEKILGTLE